PSFGALAQVLDEQSNDRGVLTQHLIPTGIGCRDRLVQRAVGLVELALLPERLGEIGQEAEPPWVVGRVESHGPPQEIRRGRHVAPGERPPTRGRQPRGAANAELEAVLVERPELREVPVRLLEVVAEDLLELAGAVADAVRAVGPVDELLV